MSDPALIQTERFSLRELTEADATVRYLGWLDNPEAKRFIVAAAQTRGLAELVDYVRQRVGRAEVLFLGIFEKSTGLHIGNIKYEPVDSARGFAIMGILVGDSAYRGKGVAGEVLRASAQWLREHRAVRLILLGVDSENTDAIRAYQRVGFVEMNSPYIKKAGPSVLTMGWMLE